MKDHLIFDTSDAISIHDSDSVGAFVRSANGDLITDHSINEQTNASLITQGLVITSKLPGAVGNSYSFTVIDTTPGAMSFTEIAGAIVIDLHNTTPTAAQVATLLASSAYVDAVAGSPAGNVIVASILSLIGGSDTSIHKHLDVFSITADASGNAITSTLIAGKQALDVNIASPVVVNVDTNGIYNVSTNPLPANVGLIGSSRAAPGLANQTLQFTGGSVTSDAVPTADIVAQDVNSFNMVWNGTTWDRATGTAANGSNVNITNPTIAVTQSTSPWVVSGTVTVDQGTSPWVTTAAQSGTWTVGLSEDHNYGTVGANTLRTASQIGNATGAADFNSGVTTAQTLRVTLATDDTITTSDAALANGTAIAHSLTLAAANTAQSVVTSPLAARKYLMVYNFSNKQIFIGGASVTAAQGFPVSPGSYMELRAGAASTVSFVGQTGFTPEIRTLELA